MFREEEGQGRVEKAGFQKSPNYEWMENSTASGYTGVLSSNKERLAVHLLVNQPQRTDRDATMLC